MSKVAIGLTRAMPGTAAGRSSATPSSAAIGRIEVDDQVARDDVGDPAGGRGAGVLPHPAERDDHRQPDGQAAERQRGPAPVADDRAAGEALLEPEDGRERRPGDPGDGRQDERDQQRGDEQDRRRPTRAWTTPAPAAGARQDDDADERDDDEDDRQPAQPGGPRGRAGRAVA